MRLSLLIGGAGICFILILFFTGLLDPGEMSGEAPGDESPEILLVYASAGIMPQLLNTSQVDAFLIWEPVVATAELGGIGKQIASPADMPPPGAWNTSACCVVVMRNAFIEEYPDIAALISAITKAGIARTNEDRDHAITVTASWVFGSGPIRSAGLSLNPRDVEELAFQSINFTGVSDLPGFISGLNTTEDTETDPESFMNRSVSLRADELLAGSPPNLSDDCPVIEIGYLPSSDHNAPFYLAITDHELIYSTYGFALVPEAGQQLRPDWCDLVVENRTIARVHLLPGQVGGGIMTGIGQEAIDVGYLGSVPAEMQIALGNNASIIHSINDGGTGLVVDEEAPCENWDEFITWTRNRSAQNRPVILAIPQSSIQEEIIREALMYEGIHASLYGLPDRVVQ